jgi:hypothetical protein
LQTVNGTIGEAFKLYVENVSAEAKAKAKKDDTYFGLSKSNQ